jgi:hypothetical protein
MAELAYSKYSAKNENEGCPDCIHSKEKTFRGHCIFCLFDGTEEYEDQWDDVYSLSVMVDDIAIRAIELGKFHRKLGKFPKLYPCKSKCKNAKSLHKLFTIGWNCN